MRSGSATLSYPLAKGRPVLIPGLTNTLVGITAEIAAITWLGANVTHSLSESG
ncbi:hypothetical protein D9M70_647670 [compost metagenome]